MTKGFRMKPAITLIDRTKVATSFYQSTLARDPRLNDNGMKPMKQIDLDEHKTEKMRYFIERKQDDKEAKILQHNMEHLEFQVGDIGSDDVRAETGSNGAIQKLMNKQVERTINGEMR